jgi:hypothetical protein
MGEQNVPKNYVNTWSIITPDGKTIEHYEPVKPKNGLKTGRWIYCDGCYKNVVPTLSGLNQIRCPECGYGITPDFVRLANLQLWLDGKADEALANDEKARAAISPEEWRKMMNEAGVVTSTEQKVALKRD